MRLTIPLFSLIVLIGPFAPSASAQTPDTGLIGVGGDVGVRFADEALENTFTIDGFGEWYVTPRIGVRAMLAWAKPGFENRTEDKFRQTMLLFSGTYNWEFVEWHPFVAAGAGAYFVRPLLEGASDPDAETRGGIHFGGGAEYFVNSMSSIKAEGRWDIVSHPAGVPDATGFSLTVGFKRYF